eukprot:7334868-Pyramimonas_sp.AAC.1
MHQGKGPRKRGEGGQLVVGAQVENGPPPCGGEPELMDPPSLAGIQGTGKDSGEIRSTAS